MVEAAGKTKSVWEILELVKDPEIPVLSVVDLGIVRDIQATDDGVEVTITPTYSGCPAMEMIAGEIITMLRMHGYGDPKIVTQISPVWTTDWMTTEGRRKLKEYGIAPPVGGARDKAAAMLSHMETVDIECPQCNSLRTEKINEFGSTSCKALYRCLACQEPFDYFKCL